MSEFRDHPYKAPETELGDAFVGDPYALSPTRGLWLWMVFVPANSLASGLFLLSCCRSAGERQWILGAIVCLIGVYAASEFLLRVFGQPTLARALRGGAVIRIPLQISGIEVPALLLAWFTMKQLGLDPFADGGPWRAFALMLLVGLYLIPFSIFLGWAFGLEKT